MRNRILPIGITLFTAMAVFAGALWISSQEDSILAEQPELTWSTENPNGLSVIESKLTPKSENPGERYEHDFMLTRDPVTNTVPVERLVEASRAVTEMKRTKSALLAASTSWTERGPDDVGGRTRAIMFDPNDVNNEKVFAGGVSGGLWFTNDITDPAETWTGIDDFWSNLAVTAMAYDPTNTQVFYVGTGEGFFNIDAVQGGGVFKSTDGGTTWAQLSSTTPSGGDWVGVQDLVVTSTGTVLASTRDGNGVQRSSDGGTTWTAVLDGGTGSSTSRAADLEIDTNGDIYAAMGVFSGGEIWRSLDDGLTWTLLNSGVTGFPTTGVSRIEIATAPSDSNVVYALTHDNVTNGIEGIYRSSDYGVSWVSMPLPADCDVVTISAADFTRSQAWYDLIAVVNPTDPNDLIVGGIDIFRTSNGNADSGAGAGSGATWEQISIWLSPGSLGCTNSPAPPVVHADQHAMVYRPGSSTEVVFGHDGGIDYTADVTVSGASLPTFVNRNNGYNVTQFYAGSINPTTGTNLMFGGTQDNGTPQLNSAGIATSFGDATGGDGGLTHLNQATNVLAMGANTGASLHRSLNGGTSWTALGSVGGCSASFINPSDLDDGTNELFLSCGTASLASVFNLVSGTIGVNTLNPIGGFGSTPTHIRASPFGSTSIATVYVGTAGGTIFRGTNLENGGTQAWTTIATTPFAGSVSISSIDFRASEDTLLVTLSNYGVSSVWETFDGGTSWNNRDSATLPDVPVRWGMYDPNDRTKVLLATEVGVIETDDITAVPVVWTPASGFPTVRTDMLKYRASDGTLLAVTHGRGLWTGTLTTLPVELVAFNSVVDGNDVILQWNTASESSNAGFEIERALRTSATKSAELQFESLGFVDGRGTTSEPQSYAFRIEDVEAGEYTFRLKQVDFSGSIEYSDMIEVSIELPGEALLSQAYPNPFTDEATIRLQVKKTQDVEVALYDMQGRRVATLFSGEVPANEATEITIKADGLASGQYIYRAIGSSFTDSKTISLIK